MSNNKRIKIVSAGMGSGTKVYNHDGAEILGIQKITISPIEGGELVTCTITFIDYEVEIKALEST